MSGYDSTKCDLCGRRRVGTWTITNPERIPAVVGLCAQHTPPVADAWAAGVDVPSERVKAAPRRRLPYTRRKDVDV